MEVAANHADPGERVPCVGTCLVESHHMSQMGQLCVLLHQTHLRERKRRQTAFNSTVLLLYNNKV